VIGSAVAQPLDHPLDRGPALAGIAADSPRDAAHQDVPAPVAPGCANHNATATMSATVSVG
jgi:hypothetical protein